MPSWIRARRDAACFAAREEPRLEVEAVCAELAVELVELVELEERAMADQSSA
ncbi:hypothetical protein GCM10027157_08320 [Corynebacterium aquatimens]